MNNVPKWLRPVGVIALLWNLLGCAAYLHDVRMTAGDIARLSPAEHAMYVARPAWAVAATAIAVWGGAFGCLGLVLRQHWAYALLCVSLLGIIVQDIALFGVLHAAGLGVFPIILQSIVLIVAVLLVLLARKAISNGWIPSDAGVMRA